MQRKSTCRRKRNFEYAYVHKTLNDSLPFKQRHLTRTCIRRNYWGARDLRTYKFSALGELGQTTNNKKWKHPKTKTLNDRLPPKHWLYTPQTLAKYVSEYPQHVMFRPPQNCFSDLLFRCFSDVCSGSSNYFEELWFV